MTPATAAAVLAEVAAERARQDEKWGEQNHPDGTGQHPEQIEADVARMVCDAAAEGGYLDWLHIAREEVFEAFAEPRPAQLRTELIQCAAVFVAWAEAIDRRAKKSTDADLSDAPDAGTYRKKPVEIQAVRWTGDNAEALAQFTDGKFDAFDQPCDDDPEATASVLDSLHSTWVLCHTGDWIIRGVAGEFYPCRSAVFHATYEAATNG